MKSLFWLSLMLCSFWAGAQIDTQLSVPTDTVQAAHVAMPPAKQPQ
jgi:hypothetical protein